MIITRKYARELARNGRAEEGGALKPDSRGRVYVVLTRFDLSRTDHYLATAADVMRLRPDNA
jgi:hypothetical protein